MNMPNYDEKTGISYGVISPNAVNPDALSDVYSRGTDPHYEAARDEEEEEIMEFLKARSYLSDDESIAIKDELMDVWNDHFDPCGDGQCDYSDKDYTLHVSGDDFGIFVIKSPYYTFCRKCSPCAPGAGDLDNATDVILGDDGVWVSPGEMAYCLGKEFFDDGDEPYSRKIPYRIFRVDNDREVI